MSFNFDNNINRFKAQSAYKDASGMGGGGMYFQQKKKDEEDLFEHSKDEDVNEIGDLLLGKNEENEIIPQDNFFNKFVNWFRLKKD